jgi:hypothetical protein
MYSEATDLCGRISSAGGDVRHCTWMAIVDYGGTTRVDSGFESVSAYSHSTDAYTATGTRPRTWTTWQF